MKAVGIIKKENKEDKIRGIDRLSVRDWMQCWESKSFNRIFVEKLKEIYFNKMFSNLVKKYLKNGRILEAGCGTALSSFYLSKGFETVGCDFCPTIIQKARQRCKYFLLCDIKALPFKDNSFDMVFNQGTMQYFDDQDFLIILNEFKRVSKRTLIIIPSKLSLFRLYNIFGKIGGIFFSKKELSLLMNKVFTNYKVYYLFQSFFLSLAGYAVK